jgi:hypothetical protein
MLKYLERYKLKDISCFQDKIRLIKDSYYFYKFGQGDIFKSSVRYENFQPVLELFGIDFIYVFEKERLQILERSYDYVELICIVCSLFKYLDSINKRGYVNDSVFNNNMFMSHVNEFLVGFDYESMKLGNSELPYTMWYNLIFINFY